MALPPAFSIFATAAFSLSARRATSATDAPFAARTSAKRRPSPPDAPVTSATRPFRSNSSAAFMRSSSPPIKRMRQRGRKPRHIPKHDQSKELNDHERDDANVDVAGGDLRRRHAAQEEQRRPERRVHVRRLQVH